MKYQQLNKFVMPVNFRGRNAIIVQLWWIVQATLFACSPQFAYKWRNFLLRIFGAEIGKDVIIRPSARITYPWKLKVGDYSWIGDNVELYTLGNIIIGNNAVISQRCYLCAASHDYQSEAFDIFSETVTIEDEVWLATDVFIAPGITIKRGALVGARSSVFKDMPEGMICLGSPAKVIGPRIND
jgi:putative colanic acid biosynthesis acetyltransferase WcaF